jgi:transposase InsO family protein
MCQVLQVSRSGYYDWQVRPESKRTERDRVLLGEIRKIHGQSKEAYGAIKTWRRLRQTGVICGRHRVARLRRSAGIEARRTQKFRLAYQARNQAPAAPNLLKAPFSAGGVNQVWMADVTFISTRAGWLYLAVLIDLYSRRVVGWSMAEHLRTELVLDALDMAISQRQPAPGLVCHSDHGCQLGFKGSLQHRLVGATVAAR